MEDSIRFTKKLDLNGIRSVHFIGIGGIGMSGIARLMLGMGYRVTGSDMKSSEITSALSAEGAAVRIGHSACVPEGTDVVVISSAVKIDNIELQAAVGRGLPVVQRAFMLSQLASLKKTVTVAGTHGKTTTSTMVSSAMAAAGAKATSVVGGIIKSAGSNLSVGGGEYFIAEADESDGSFLCFSPLVACVTNIDRDHLDHYKTMTALKEAFIRHISSVPFYGCAVLCADDEGIRSVLPYITSPYLTCSCGGRADWTAEDVRLDETGARYEAWFKGRRKGSVRLQCGGLHNVRNSLLALAAGSYLGFSFDGLASGLAAFTGVKRRIDRIGSACGIDFVDDYAHHPTEIKATLAAAGKLFPGRRIVVLFQPHRYTRTQLLYRDFGAAFGDADKVYIAPVYPAGEKSIPGVGSELILRELLKNGVDAGAFVSPLALIKDLRRGDVVFTLGAGDVWKYGEEMKRRVSALCGGF